MGKFVCIALIVMTCVIGKQRYFSAISEMENLFQDGYKVLVVCRMNQVFIYMN